MAFIEKLDDKVTKWQSSKRANLLIYSYFVNFATLPLQSFFHYVGCHPIPARYRVNVGGTSREYRGNIEGILDHCRYYQGTMPLRLQNILIH